MKERIASVLTAIAYGVMIAVGVWIAWEFLTAAVQGWDSTP